MEFCSNIETSVPLISPLTLMQFNSHSQESSGPNERWRWRGVYKDRGSRSLPDHSFLGIITAHHKPSLATRTTSPSTAAYFPTGSNNLGCSLIWTAANRWVWIWQYSCCQYWDWGRVRNWGDTHLHTHILSFLHTATDTHPHLYTPSSTPTSLILISTDIPHVHLGNLHWEHNFQRPLD